MLHWFRLIVIIVSLFFTLNAFTGSCQDYEANGQCPDQKIYVLPEQLGISRVGILVNLDNQWYKAEALLSDENGIYIKNFWPQRDGCRKYFAPCRNCDRCIEEYWDICPHCQRPA